MPLKLFIPYYGGKVRIAGGYPTPKWDTIIEPFAGGAGYSLHYPECKVILYDLDARIVGIWDYLIHVSESEFLQLPDTVKYTSFIHVCPEAKDLIGWWRGAGLANPKNTVSNWMVKYKKLKQTWGPKRKGIICNQLKHIRHWKVYQASYTECSNEKATWFIDPPYEGEGDHYKFGNDNINYKYLAKWCKSREGQVIVCESNGAKWLPFEKFTRLRGTLNHITMEMVYYQENGKCKKLDLSSHTSAGSGKQRRSTRNRRTKQS